MTDEDYVADMAAVRTLRESIKVLQKEASRPPIDPPDQIRLEEIKEHILDMQRLADEFEAGAIRRLLKRRARA